MVGAEAVVEVLAVVDVGVAVQLGVGPWLVLALRLRVGLWG